MYLIESNSSFESINQEELGRASAYKGSAPESAWILYTVIAACVLILLIIIVIIYDLCLRCRDSRGQQIYDGGPPSSPDHQHVYQITISVDQVSPSFDVKQSTLRIELLDIFNQYLTSVVVPCFLFKIKTDDSKASEPAYNSSNQAAAAAAAMQGGAGYKSLTTLYDNWSGVRRSNVIKFSLVRRNPLINLSSVRVTHDCYKQDAQILLKYILVYEESTRQTVRIDLTDRPIKSLHPCPPNGIQVFKIEALQGDG